MIQFIKIRDVKSPVRNEGAEGVFDAGIDLYVPEYSKSFIEEIKTLNEKIYCFPDCGRTCILLKKGDNFKIPLGVMFKFDSDLVMRAGNKSGICSKQHIVYGADTIASTYQGEWIFNGIALENTHIDYGQKIIQFIPCKISTEQVEEEVKTPDEFFTEKTIRGTGGFGSTKVS